MAVITQFSQYRKKKDLKKFLPLETNLVFSSKWTDTKQEMQGKAHYSKAAFQDKPTWSLGALSFVTVVTFINMIVDRMHLRYMTIEETCKFLSISNLKILQKACLFSG